MGDHSFSVVARDGAENETTVTHHYTVARRRAGADRRSARAKQGAQYDVGADVHADYSCADEGGSGLASCTGDVPNGDPLNTATPGAYDFTVVARDGAGHETTVTNSYTVVEPPPPPPDLGFAGFFGPIHNGSVVHAGDAISIVFGLDGYHGLRSWPRLAEQRAGRLPASRPGDGRRAGPQPVRSGPALQPPDRPLRLHPGRPRPRGRGPAAPSSSAFATASVQRLTVSFRPGWRWRRTADAACAPVRRLAAQGVVLDLALELLQRAAQMPRRWARRPARRPSPGCRSPPRRRRGAARRGCGPPAARAGASARAGPRR